MPIIRDGEKARAIIENIKKTGNALPCFCTENVITTEAIFKGVQEYKTENNIKVNIPLIIAFTASYSERTQLLNYTSLKDYREGLKAVRDDIERLAREDGPYSDIDVIVHLDHAQPKADDWIFEENKDFISSVMYDCSHYSMEENMKMVTDFVKKYKKDFIVEGCVDEIYNFKAGAKGEVKDNITEAATAENYYKETGADLIVANLGTEHRRTAGALKKYHRDAAQAIQEKIGRNTVLHGTSSLSLSEIVNLPADGIVKVNIWTIFETTSGRKMAEEMVRNIDKILTADTIKKLVEDGILSKDLLSKEANNSLDFMTEKYRRDDIMVPEVVKLVKEFYKNFYINF